MLQLRAESVDWREIDGEVVALDVRTSRYLGVNPAGSLLWSLLAAGTTRPAMVRQLLDTFDVAEDEAERDVDDFVQDLRSRDLLVEAAG